jgi:hypothetical protein
MSKRLASLGLQGYRRLVRPFLQNTNTSGAVKIVPSTPTLSLNDVIGLSNSVYINNSLPVELALPQKPIVPNWVESSIRARFDQIDINAIIGSKETLNEKNYNAQTVQSHLNLVSGLVAHNKSAFQLLQTSVANFGELNFAAVIKQKRWVQIKGRADFSWNCKFPLAATHGGIAAKFDRAPYNAFTEKCDRCIGGDTSTFELLTERPSMQSGFKIGAKDIPYPLAYPAMDLCIEYKGDVTIKRDHFEGQTALYLVASSIAYAYWGSVDDPFMVVGVVSDGARYTFLVFQLNTLDFSVQSQAKNFLWRIEMTLFDNQRKFNSTTLEQLAQIVSFILDQQKGGMLKHNPDVKLQSRKKRKE